MRFDINTKLFLESVDLVSGILSSGKSPSSVMRESVFLFCDENGITLFGNSFSEMVEKRIIVGIEKPKNIGVNAKRLLSVLKNVDFDVVHCETIKSDTVLSISDKEDKWNLPLVSDDNFTERDSYNWNGEVEIPEHLLKMGFSKTIFCAERMHGKFVFDCVSIKKEGSLLSVYATNGMRMALFTSKIGGAGEDFNVHIPQESAGFLESTLSSDETKLCYVSTNEKKSVVRVRTDSFSFISFLVEGNVPNVAEFIPKENAAVVKLVFNKESIVSALKKLLPIVAQNYPFAKSELVFNEKKCILSSEDQSTGDGKVFCAIETVEKQKDDFPYFCFNPHSLLMGLQRISQATFSLRMGEDANSIVIEVPNWTFVQALIQRD